MVWPSWADYGNVPSWAGAIVTSGSFLAGAIALRRTAKARESEQAELVNVTMSRDPNGDSLYITVQNRSLAPVYRMTARTLAIATGAYVTDVGTAQFVHPTAPDAKHSKAWESTAPKEAGEVWVVIRFRDAGGRWWTKTDDGVLTRQSDGNPPTRKMLFHYQIPGRLGRAAMRYEIKVWKRQR